MVNQQLVDYFKTHHAQGYSHKQIRQYLLKQGYLQNEVDEAMRLTLSLKTPAPVAGGINSLVPKGKRPQGVTIIGYLLIIFPIIGFITSTLTLVGLYLGLTSSMSALQEGPAVAYAPIIPTIILGIALFSFVMNIILIFTGWGLLKLKRWARTITIIYSIFILLVLPIGTIMGIIFLIVMYKDTTKQAFGIK